MTEKQIFLLHFGGRHLIMAMDISPIKQQDGSYILCLVVLPMVGVRSLVLLWVGGRTKNACPPMPLCLAYGRCKIPRTLMGLVEELRVLVLLCLLIYICLCSG
jgi:hypothetical protein